MKKNKILIIVIFLCFSSICSKAQNTVSLNEMTREAVHLSTNSKVFLVGETLYYNFFCLLNDNKNASLISKIGYIELVGDNEEILFKHKLNLDKGIGYGDYFIPTEIKTGQYKLVAYTKWIHDTTASAAYIGNVYILNPYLQNQNNEDSESVNEIQISESKNDGFNEEANSIQIEINSNIVNSRSLVSIDLKSSFEDLYFGNYSLSVRKTASIEIQDKTVENNIKIKWKNDFNMLPELRGEIISGTIKSKEKDSLISNIIVSLSIPGKNYVFKNVKTDQFGKFKFNLYENYKTSDVLIQIVDEQKTNYKIILDDFNFIDYSNLDFTKIKINQNLEDWLVKQSIYNQVENAYYNSKKDSVLIERPPNLFYGKASIEYVLDDYKRFPTLKETFIEVIQAGAIRNSKEDFKFKVYDIGDDKYGHFINYSSLVLFDGIMIQDKDVIMDYAVKNIESINLVNGTYFYGPSIFHGIIDIKTKQEDFKLPDNGSDIVTFNLESPLSHKMYYSPNYSENSNDLKRIPDYRSQLLWLPSLKLDSNLKTIEFYTSDIEGGFEIVLEGFTLAGKHVVSKHYFEVKNPR
ncbi:hypothetical protein [Confluentibacter citreus]|uniref:hypothetical protein n=1 Tax=Confluentibacter citreus TaxID=2007307 RepID=UPI000C293741|nr:hypothetical protein [Confluentibacter citreus]